MFSSSYWPSTYWADDYWAKLGGETVFVQNPVRRLSPVSIQYVLYSRIAIPRRSV